MNELLLLDTIFWKHENTFTWLQGGTPASRLLNSVAAWLKHVSFLTQFDRGRSVELNRKFLQFASY
jgi:hypothetical protein